MNTEWSWQCDQECFMQYGLDSPTGWNDEIVVAGYRYNWPTELQVIAPPIPSIPEPSAWLMLIVGLAVVGLWKGRK